MPSAPASDLYRPGAHPVTTRAAESAAWAAESAAWATARAAGGATRAAAQVAFLADLLAEYDRITGRTTAYQVTDTDQARLVAATTGSTP